MLAIEPLTLDVYLRSLVAQASSLTERLNQVVIPTDSNPKDPKINSRIDLWCQVVAKGDVEKFIHRLAGDGLEHQTLHPLLGDVEYPKSQPLPSWAQTLEKILQTAQNLKGQNLSNLSPFPSASENPIPFEPFYHPFVQVAQHQLLSLVALNRLSEAAQASLLQSLLSRLQNIATGTLFTEFSEFRSSGNPVRDFFLVQICGKTSQEKYYAFLHQLFQDGLLSFFEKYPVLGRLLATAVEFWVETTAEFIHRLTTDWAELQQQFSPQTALQQVVDLKANLSDLHNQGRSAIALTFNTGLQLVYKPKNLQMEVAYNQIVQWCNEHGTPLPLKVFSVLNQGNYGWVEFVHHQPCPDEAAAQRYYQRCGMILGLVYLLQGTDCHNENLIASGEHPVLIDLETLLFPQTKNLDSLDLETPQIASQIAQQQLNQSVLRTMLLPQRGIMAKDSIQADLSGFGGVEEKQESILTLRHINTDGMDVGYEKVTVESNANAAKLRGVILHPLDYLEELVTGFDQMYRFFTEHRQALLHPDSPLMRLAEQTIRYVFRATNIYHSILNESYSPHLFKSGIERSIGLDVLSRGFLTSEAKLQLLPILAMERQAMEEGDIPFFKIDTSQTCLPLATGAVMFNMFAQPSFASMLNQIHQLSETDLARQIAIIRGSFAARFTQEPLPPASPQGCFIADRGDKGENVSSLSLQLVQQAVSLAEQLQQTAIAGQDGSVTWLGLAYRTKSEGFCFQPLEMNLYDGSCGVALFLAALAKITGESQWRDLAYRTLQPLCQTLRQSSPEMARFARSMGIGGATGLGSIAYALVLIGNFLEDAALLSTAHQVTLLITPESIASDRYFDLTRGSAGTTLGLLAVYAANPDEKSVLKKAIACGQHLLDQRTPIEGLKTWKTWNGKALTGFSQGAAGIAYALLRLWAVTQDEQFLEAAQDAIAYERRCFSPEAGNWQDLRPSTPQYQISWAHGAPGIALGRIGSLSLLDTPDIRQEIAIALDTTRKYGIWGVDNLAWGNFGRLETLLVASDVLKRPELRKTALDAVQLIQQTQGNFTLYANFSSSVPNPGFLQGTSGIGYQLLRLAYTQFPSVLSFEL